MNKRGASTFTLFIGLLLPLAACADDRTAPSMTAIENDVAVATVKALLQGEYTRDPKTKVFSLCFAEFTDPSSEFLAQFSPANLVPCSQTFKNGHSPPSFEVGGLPAKTAMIGVPKVISSTEAIVGVIFWHSAGFATGARFHLELKGNVWLVVKREGTFIT